MKVACPPMGSYTKVFQELENSLGWELTVLPSPSDRSIELGARYMNELMCLPAKVTLGSLIQACEMGAKKLLMFDSCGECRLKTYWILQERALRKLGYDVTVYPIRLGKETPSDIRRVDPSIPYWKACLVFIRVLRRVIRLDREQLVEVPEGSELVKIGIVGEIYCYSDDTEILTENGWKLFRDMEKDERIVQVDPTTLNLNLVEPREIYSLDYKGKMVKLKSKQIDLLVTPNHRVLYQTRNDAKKVTRADTLPDRVYIFKAGNWEGGEIEPKRFGSISMTPEQFCKFMGIWLAEGCISSPNYLEKDSYGRTKGGYRKRYNIFITQKDEGVRKKIEELFQEIGITIDYNHYSKAGSGSYRFQNKELWGYLRQFGKSRDKFIPREIANGGRRCLELFLGWFWYGDGGSMTKVNKTIRYKSQKDSLLYRTQTFASASKNLIDGIQEILFKLNRQGNVCVDKCNGMYSIRVRKTDYAQLKGNHKEKVNYDGKVYCVSVDKGFVVVRRNNIACISGNSILEPVVNKGLIQKIERMGALVHNSLPLSYFIFKKFYNKGWMKRRNMDNHALILARKRAHEYFPKEIGGHGNESIIHTIYYALKGFDGVIHILPFPCAPEATVAPILDDISRDYSIPVMRLIFDTHTGEVGLNTRLEAFIDILKRKKVQLGC